MHAFSFSGLWAVFKDAANGFLKDKVPKLGGSLAYFTVFSLGPMLLVVIFLAGLLLGRQAVEGSLYNQIHQLVGPSAAQQVQQLIKSAFTSGGGGTAAIIGFVTLLIGATSVFTEMQDSINTILKLELKPGGGWKRLVKSRLISFGVIGSIGFLLLISLTASAIIEGFGSKLGDYIPGVSVMMIYVLSQAFTLLVATLLFSIIFKVLPAGKIRWRDVWQGALVTAILFMLGRFAISFYISKSDFGNTYGAAGSLVVLLVWVYYSSLILYFGVEFTRAYATRFGTGINPYNYAVSTEKNRQ
jgi:membrane protein